MVHIQVIGNDIELTGVKPPHPRDRILKRMRRDQIWSSVDIYVLKNIPYINYNAVMDTGVKLKRENVIMDLLQQNILPDNDWFYIEHDLETDTYVIKEDPD